ncbi:glutamic acid-rich protein-like [Tigriopus californicus]|nr:glutamic acid-rich protein-like [Tigriopus californicus]|eukprot:TCALIF_01438-PA protein Name:"Protein of unknown function" AED:0.02 eAED:0.02 QI:85/1/0.66/1/1/1/3/0/216
MSTTEENVHDCIVDENQDHEDPNNLFTCAADQSCCTVDLNPACCATKDLQEEIKEQVKLWVPLLAIIMVLAIFIWWCRSDDSCCDVEKPCLYRFGCKKYEDLEEDAETGSQVSLRSAKSSTTIMIGDDDQGHDAAELELAAENLEAVLEDEPELVEGEDIKEQENKEDEPEGDDEAKEDGEANDDKEEDDTDEPKKDEEEEEEKEKEKAKEVEGDA